MMSDLVEDIEPVLEDINDEIESIRKIIRDNSYVPLNIKEARSRFQKKTSLLSQRTKSLAKKKPFDRKKITPQKVPLKCAPMKEKEAPKR